MRILIVNYEYPPIGGGGGFVTRDIAEEIAEKGHHVTVITSSFKELSKKEIVNKVEIIRVPAIFRKKIEVANNASMVIYLISSICYCLTRLGKKSFDVINTHFAIPTGPTGLVLSKFFGVPNVLSIHGGDIYDPSKKMSPHQTPILSQTVQYILNKSDIVVAQSSNTYANANQFYDIKKQIDIIPLGIKKPIFEKKERQFFGLSKDDFVFCTIGRLVNRKNINEALNVISKLKNINKNIKFLIIGDGPEKENIKDGIKNLGLEKHVFMLGNVSDKEKFQLLDLSDCFMSTAMHEGFGLVFLEAMACGLPVVCYDNGGQTDFLINGQTGFINHVGDVDGILTSVQNLMNNKNMFLKMSNFNRNHVKEFYIQRCGEKYIDLFQKAIEKMQVL